MTPSLPESDHVDEATDWFVRSQAHDFGAADRAALQRWLDADAEHRHAFDQVERTWGLLAVLGGQRHRDAAASIDGSRTPSRRRALLGAAIPLALGVWWSCRPGSRATGLDFEHELISSPRERLTLALPDGSRLVLNVDSWARVRFAPGLRQVTLLRGEAFFDVVHEARLFEVLAADVVARAMASQFSVRRLTLAVQVAVTQGHIELKSLPVAPAPASPRGVNAGEALQLSASGVSRVATPAAELASWRTGQLILNNRPLPEVAAELSRYRERVVEVGDSAAASVRVSGVVDLAQPDAFLRALPEVVAVRVDEQANRSVIFAR